MSGEYDDFGLRFCCERELDRLGLTWKSPRVKTFLSRCCGWPNAILADATEEMLAALLEKLRAEPSKK